MVVISVIVCGLAGGLSVLIFGMLVSQRLGQVMRSILNRLVLMYLLLVLGLLLHHVLRPHHSGLLALTQVLAPYLFLPFLLSIPFAALRGMVMLRWTLITSAGLFFMCFVLPLASVAPPSTATRVHIRVMNWNVNVCCGPERQAARVRPVLSENPADVIVLEEAYWEWLQHDPVVSKLYPYQLNHTKQASSGLVLLSAYPILDHGQGALQVNINHGWPRLIWARLDVGQGQQLMVVAAHPEGPYSAMGQCHTLLCYDTAERDSLIPHIRNIVDSALARGEHVLLLGDMNVTEREPTYHELTRGLIDAYRATEQGFGHTWGILPQLNWSTPLLRIDYLFSSPNVVPLDTTVDCTLRGSDHCTLSGVFGL